MRFRDHDKHAGNRHPGRASVFIKAVGIMAMATAASDFTSALPKTGRGDEIGALARNLDPMRISLSLARDARLEQEEGQKQQSQVMDALRLALRSLAEGKLNFRLNQTFPEHCEPLRRDVNDVIATTTSSQSKSLGEISAGLLQLDQVTQKNAGMVEQAATAHHAIRQDAEHLADLVARFQWGNMDRGLRLAS